MAGSRSFRLPAGFVPPEVPEPPAVPRDAATVMLVRDGHDAIEVFLQQRVMGMAFAGGMTVFPGGGVDPRDADDAPRWAGPSPEAWAGWFGCDEKLATALVCAAVRETFEESGVLLAGAGPDDVVADSTQFHTARVALESRELSLAEFLADAGLMLRADLLRPWSSWVTPPQEPRRYDTRFFLAALPEGQHADGATTEAESSVWAHPADALAEAEAGRRVMLPPTQVTLTQLTEFSSVQAALAAERAVPRFAPVVVRDADGARVEFQEEA